MSFLSEWLFTEDIDYGELFDFIQTFITFGLIITVVIGIYIKVMKPCGFFKKWRIKDNQGESRRRWREARPAEPFYQKNSRE